MNVLDIGTSEQTSKKRSFDSVDAHWTAGADDVGVLAAAIVGVHHRVEEDVVLAAFRVPSPGVAVGMQDAPSYGARSVDLYQYKRN